MQKTSAGILMYRNRVSLEVLLIHPGGPYFRNKDDGYWSIPKGEIDEGEDGFAAARREFEEETGCRPEGEFRQLGKVRQKSGKVVLAWSVKGDCDEAKVVSNVFRLEWPPHSGRIQDFPEVDRAGWFTIEAARKKINPAQVPLLEELSRLILSA